MRRVASPGLCGLRNGLSPLLWGWRCSVDTVNMHAAKSQLSKLVQRAAAGETILIAKSGHPVARLAPLETDSAEVVSRLGFLAGQLRVPDDFAQLAAAHIAAEFAGE